MDKCKIPSSHSIKEIQWEKPLQGFYKLNTNKIAKGDLNFASCSAIVKDSDDKLVVACSKGLRCATNFVSELCALRDSLLLIRDRGLVPMINEANSLYVINVLKDFNKLMSSSISNLIKDYKFLLHPLWNPTIKYVYREANTVADFVAKIIVYSSNDLAILNVPPKGLYIYG